MKILASCMAGQVVLGAAAAPGLQEKEREDEFKQPAAQAAVKRFEAAVAEARDAYERRVGQARDELIPHLEAALTRATNQGDLDDAVKLRDRIRELKESAPAAPAAGSLAGVYVASHPDWGPGREEVHLVKDGRFRRPAKGDQWEGTWEFTGGNLVLRWKDWPPTPLTPVPGFLEEATGMMMVRQPAKER